MPYLKRLNLNLVSLDAITIISRAAIDYAVKELTFTIVFMMSGLLSICHSRGNDVDLGRQVFLS
jgi:hypothetical protein